jgi:predicted metal-dependent phosphoesterase TrpH
MLTIAQLQREAQRRGLDVIAVSGHNNRVALDLARATGGIAGDVIVLESQELTAPGFHMIAVGVREMIDWRLPVPEAVRAIHAQGGVAIAAHPAPLTWKPLDEASLRALDGVEVAHPMTAIFPSTRRELDEFFERVRSMSSDVAPIGSTDFHATAPIGLCRTYLLTSDRSAAGAIEAIRRGRTVAADQDGHLFGAAEHIAVVEEHLAGRGRPSVPLLHRLVALAALLSLAAVCAGPKHGLHG